MLKVATMVVGERIELMKVDERPIARSWWKSCRTSRTFRS